MLKAKTQLPVLTGIRFFLAIWVVVFHQRFLDGYAFRTHFPGPIASLLGAGYMAVGIFFLLSGFVLSYNYSLEKPWTAREIRKFGLARFARIYPAYALALLLSIPGVFAMMRQSGTVLSVNDEVVKAGTVWTLTQAWWPTTAAAWNAPGWSLSAEICFYCLFPFIGVVLWKARSAPNVLVLALAVWGISLLAPAAAVIVPLRDAAGSPAWMWNQDSSGTWVNLLKFNPLFHVPEFCFGILTGRLYGMLRDGNSRLAGNGYMLYLPGLALEVVAIVEWEPALFPFLHNGLLLPLHALVILGFAFDGGWLAKVLATRPLALLGNSSYAVYIFQAPIGAWISTIAKRLFSIKLWGWGATAVHLGVLSVFSILIFIFVEEPASRILKKKLGPLLGISQPNGNGLDFPANASALAPGRPEQAMSGTWR